MVRPSIVLPVPESDTITVVGAFVAQVTAPIIENVPMALAATEYFYALPATTKRFAIQNRGAGRIQLSYLTGQTNVKFWTLPGNGFLSEDGISPAASITLFFESNLAAQVLEVMSWT